MHHTRPVYAYRKPAELDSPQPGVPAPLVIVGAGPVGLSAAIDFTERGVPVIVLDEDDTVSEGSRAIAYAKRTLEAWNRLGFGDRVTSRGVSWKVGKVFHQDSMLYQFDMQANNSQEMPAYVNLQQYHVEEMLVQRCEELGIEIRWKNRVAAVRQDEQVVTVTVATPDGDYEINCEWLIAADGARSQVRRSLGLTFTGRVFDERFLIMDIKMLSERPPERWFWFDPPFNPGKSALLHMQADNIWRVGHQLGIRLDADFDAELEKSPERVMGRLRAMLGDEVDFELDWVSIFTFQCRRLDDFVHGRVIFVGDAAHQVSPFGGRGANSGVQDAENLAWKLTWIMDDRAPRSLLDSYTSERGEAADENILLSTRTTDFVTPKTRTAEIFRDAVLTLATRHSFARSLVNSGKLSVATVYHASPLSTDDDDDDDGFGSESIRPGESALDAPLRRADGSSTWLLRELPAELTILFYGSQVAARELSLPEVAAAAGATLLLIAPEAGVGDLRDESGDFRTLYGAAPGTYYLLRPDAYVAARGRSVGDGGHLRRALHNLSTRVEVSNA